MPVDNSQTKIEKNFTTSEFFSACSEFPDHFHFLDERLITGIQLIRSYYDQPIKIISSYRDYECNLAAGGAILSQHKQARALDFKFVGSGNRTIYHRFIKDITSQNVILDTLINHGIKGFGAYNNSFHIDTRTTGLHSYNGIKYSLWGKMVEDGYGIDFEHPYGIE